MFIHGDWLPKIEKDLSFHFKKLPKISACAQPEIFQSHQANYCC